MSTRVADRVDGWKQQSFADGYRGLGDLADADFSGVVRAGGAALYMTKGTVVGIEGGSIEDFEGASGTAYRAPSPALPLLAVMQNRGDEVRAKYYTEDTPIAEVDETLSEGGFTGYVELSENVLSGDYYLVYHRGRSMSVAFVGNSQQLVDGEEAFETASDEVGIYEVRPVEVGAVEVPEPEEPDPEPESGAGMDAGTAGTAAGIEAGGDEPREGSDDAPDLGVGAAGDEPGAGSERGGPPDTGPERTGRAGNDATGTGAGGDDGTGTVEAGAAGGARSDSAEADTGGGSGRDEHPSNAADGAESDADPARSESPEEPSPGRDPPGPAGSSQSPADEESGTGPRHGAGAGSSEPDGGGTSREADGASPARERDEAAAGRGQAERRPAGAEPPGYETERTETDRQPVDEQAESGPHEPAAATAGTAGGSGGDTQRTGEEAGVALETRSVPSLDPGRTSAPERAGGDAGSSAAADVGAGSSRKTPGRSSPTADRAGPDLETDSGREQRVREPGSGRSADAEPGGTEPEPEATSAGPDPDGEGETDGAARLRERLADREAEIERLETELAEASERREELETQLAEVREERDGLAAEVERLETELERVEEEFDVATGASQRLTAAEALDGTDLFVRYRSKNGTTLTDAHDGDGRREDVTENLRLEQHTQFDASEVSVDGQDYDAFIQGRVEYQFVTWLVEDLLFEVRDTGGADGLVDLYDALPDVDRAELNGTVAVRYTEDGAEQRDQETFDIVLRDRMGDPLFVANLNDSRQGASEGMMERLITAAERVGGSKDTLAGAFLVTESFFEPEALETAAEATKGGLLSRDKRRSFVNLSRKHGYHLCLVEARNQNFNLAVPEL